MIRLIKSTFYKEQKVKAKLIEFITSASKLSMGSECFKFEDNFSKFQDRRFTCFVNSGSSANLLLLQSLLNLGKIKKGDTVAFSSLTWSTNVMPIIQLGLKPVPIDVSIANLNVTSENLISSFHENPFKVIFITNLLGFCADLDKIKEFCDERNIMLLEDNCESLGSELRNEKLGNFGLASTSSFFVGHHLSTIEGGAVSTNDQELSRMLKITRAHGWSRNISNEERNMLAKKNKIDSFYDDYSFYELGFNFRPNEISGFIGNHQLLYLSEIVDLRERNFKLFHQASCKNKNLITLDVKHLSTISNFAFPMIFKSKLAFIKYRDAFLKNKVEIRPIVGGDITQQPFFKKTNDKKYKMKNANIIHDKGFYIPNNPELTKGEIETLANLISSDI